MSGFAFSGTKDRRLGRLDEYRKTLISSGGNYYGGGVQTAGVVDTTRALTEYGATMAANILKADEQFWRSAFVNINEAERTEE